MKWLRRLLRLPLRPRDMTDVGLVLAYSDAWRRSGEEQGDMLLEQIRRDAARRRDDEGMYVVHVLNAVNSRDRWQHWEDVKERLWEEAKRRGLRDV